MPENLENNNIINDIIKLTDELEIKQTVTLTYYCSLLYAYNDDYSSNEELIDKCIENILDFINEYGCYRILSTINLFFDLSSNKIIQQYALENIIFLKNMAPYVKFEINDEFFDDNEGICDFDAIKILHQYHGLTSDDIVKCCKCSYPCVPDIITNMVRNKNDIDYLINTMHFDYNKIQELIFRDVICNYGVIIESNSDDIFEYNGQYKYSYKYKGEHNIKCNVLYNLMRYFKKNNINDIQLKNCLTLINRLSFDTRLMFCNEQNNYTGNIIYDELVSNIKSHELNCIIDFNIRRRLESFICIDTGDITLDNINYVIKNLLDNKYKIHTFKTIFELVKNYDIVIDYDFTISLTILEFITLKLNAKITGKCTICLHDNDNTNDNIINAINEKYNISNMICIDTIFSKLDICCLLNKSTEYVNEYINMLIDINNIKQIFTPLWLHKFFNVAFYKRTGNHSCFYVLIKYLHDKNILTIPLHNNIILSSEILKFLFDYNYISSDDIIKHQLNLNNLEHFGSEKTLKWLNKINCIKNDYDTIIKLAKYDYASQYILNKINTLNISFEQKYDILYTLSEYNPKITADFLLDDDENILTKQTLLADNLKLINNCIKYINTTYFLTKYQLTEKELFSNIQHISTQDTSFYENIFKYYGIKRDNLLANDCELYLMICTNMMFYNLHKILQDVGFTPNDFKLGCNCFLKQATIINNIRSIKYLHKDLHFVKEDFMIENCVLLTLAEENNAANVLNYYRSNLKIRQPPVIRNIDNDYLLKNPITKQHVQNMLVLDCNAYYCSLCQDDINDNKKYKWKCCGVDICIDCGNRSIGKQEAKCPFCRKILNNIF